MTDWTGPTGPDIPELDPSGFVVMDPFDPSYGIPVEPFRAAIPPSFWDADENLIPVFVYGTLRPGQGNYGIIAPAVREIVPHCIAVGEIGFPYPTHGRVTYPAANFTRDGRIIGDALIVDHTDDAFWAADRLETGAGYTRGVAPVRFVAAGEGSLVLSEMLALAWSWPDRPHEHIVSGDWVEWSEGRRFEIAFNN